MASCLRVALGLLVLGLSGCPAHWERIHAENEALKARAAEPVYCQGAEDCEFRWGRALQWITANSSWKIRQQTDVLITTEGPMGTARNAYIVQKVPLGSGRYEIEMQTWCDNVVYCLPGVPEARAAFGEYVRSGAPEGEQAAAVE